MKKFLLIGIPFFIVLIGITVFLVFKSFNTPQKTHYHAGFVVFNNGKKLDFSDTKYMSIKPCSLSGKGEDSSKDIQNEKAHLHDNVGNVVHIERARAIWKDLFTNIHYPIDYSKTTAYINGKLIHDFQNQPIRKDDSLVVFIGKADTKLLSQAVQKNYIESKGKASSTCGD